MRPSFFGEMSVGSQPRAPGIAPEPAGRLASLRALQPGGRTVHFLP
jgi:hypothetical protein